MFRPISQPLCLATEHLRVFQLPSLSRPLVGLIAAVILFATSASIAVADEDNEDEGSFAVTSLNFETNATDGDVGIQAFFDADGLERVKIENPEGQTIFKFKAKGGLGKVGFTEVFFEGMEPLVAELAPDEERDEAEFTLNELFELFPAGEYEFEGETVEDEELEGSAILTTVLPAGPVIVAPQEDAEVPAGQALVIDWEPVTETILPDLGTLNVSGYQVIVSNEETGGEFTIDLPADITDVTVPAAFLTAGTEFDFEVLVIEESGNQTITESNFVTGD